MLYYKRSMSELAWSLDPYEREPIHPERNIDLAYTIPYEWGNFYVSQEAKDSYGLIPLTAEAQSGSPVDHISTPGNPDFSITVVGPNEFFDNEPEMQMSQTGVLRLLRQYSDSGVELKLGFSDNIASIKDVLQARLKHGLAHMFDMEPDEVEEHLGEVVDEHDIPLNESIEQEAPQMFVHGLCGVIRETGIDAMEKWSNADVNRRFYKRVKFNGAVALGGTALMTTIPTLAGEFHLPNLIATGVYASTQAFILKTSVKRYLQSENSLRQATQLFAMQFTTQATNDIHNSFCRHEFDRQMEEQFEEQ